MILLVIAISSVSAINPSSRDPWVFKSQYVCGMIYDYPDDVNYFDIKYNYKLVQYFLVNYNSIHTLLETDRIVTAVFNLNNTYSTEDYSRFIFYFFQNDFTHVSLDYYGVSRNPMLSKKPSIFYTYDDFNTRYKNFTRKKNLASWNRVEYYLQNSAIDLSEEFFKDNSGNSIKQSRNMNLKNIRFDQLHNTRTLFYCNSFQYQLFVHIESISIDSYNVFNPMDSYFKPFENNILTRHNNNTVLYKYPTNQMTNMAPIYSNVISGNITISRNAIIPDIYPYQSSNNRFTTLSNSCHNITYSNTTVIISPSDKSYKYSISVILNYLLDFKLFDNYSNVTLYQRQLVNSSNLFSLQYSITDSVISTMSYTSINNFKTFTLISHITDISKLIGSFSYSNLNNRATYLIGITDNIFQSSYPNYDWFIVKSLFIELIDSQSTYFEFDDYDTQSTSITTDYYVCPLRVSLLETSFFGGMDLNVTSTGIYNDSNNLVYSFDYGDNLNRFTGGNYDTVSVVDINSSNTVINGCIDVNCDKCIDRVCQYCSFGYYLLDGVCLLVDDYCVYDKVNRICYSSYISLNSYTELIDYLSNAYNSILVINVKLTNIQSGNSYMWYIHSITDTETFPYIPNILPSTDAKLIANLIETINDISSNQSLDIVSIKIISQDMSYVYSKFNPLEIFDNYLTYTTINQISNNYFNYMFVIPACEYLMQGSPVSMSCDVNCQYTDAYDNKIDCKENFQFNYQQFLNDIIGKKNKSKMIESQNQSLQPDNNNNITDSTTDSASTSNDTNVVNYSSGSSSSTSNVVVTNNITNTDNPEYAITCPANCVTCSNSNTCSVCSTTFNLDINSQCVMSDPGTGSNSSSNNSTSRNNPGTDPSNNNNTNTSKAKSVSMPVRPTHVAITFNSSKLSCTHQYTSSLGVLTCRTVCVCSAIVLQTFALLQCPLSIIDQTLLDSLTYSDVVVTLHSSSEELSVLRITPIASHGQLKFSIPSRIESETSPCYFRTSDLYTFEFKEKAVTSMSSTSIVKDISSEQLLSIFGIFAPQVAILFISVLQHNKIFYFTYFTDIGKTSFVTSINNSLYAKRDHVPLLSNDRLSLVQQSKLKSNGVDVYPSSYTFVILLVVQVAICIFKLVFWGCGLKSRAVHLIHSFLLLYQTSQLNTLLVYVFVIPEKSLVYFNRQNELISFLMTLFVTTILFTFLSHFKTSLNYILSTAYRSNHKLNTIQSRFSQELNSEYALLAITDNTSMLAFVAFSFYLKRSRLLLVLMVCALEVLKIWVYVFKTRQIRGTARSMYVLNSVLIDTFFVLSITPIRKDEFEEYSNVVYVVVNVLSVLKLLALRAKSKDNGVANGRVKRTLYTF